MLLIECNTDEIQGGETLIIDIEKEEITKKNNPNFKIGFQLEEIEKRILEEDGLLYYIEKYDSLEQL